MSQATILTRRDFVNQMSPRKYDMHRRAAAAEETRRRIVDATRQLHTIQGIAATRYDDIAERAGVGVGTVYRHFPSVDELIPACGRVVMEAVALPDASAARALFTDVSAPQARIERLEREAFAIYERGAPELTAARREPDAHPAVAHTATALEASLAALVDSALEPLAVTDADRRLVRAMIDLGTWQALRDQGIGSAEAVDAVCRMLAAGAIERRDVSRAT